LSAGVAQKVGPVWARRTVVVIGLAIGVYTLLRNDPRTTEPASGSDRDSVILPAPR
jgi:hypothetical protein